MKKYTLIVTGIILLLAFSFNESITNPTQPPGSRTKAPSETSCATTSCHSNENTGPGSITLAFSNPNLKYTPGDTFEITVSVADATKTRWGFEMTALETAEPNDSTPGKFLNEETGIIVSYPPPLFALKNRKYVGHKDANTTVNTWVINWAAPIVDKGNITFYAAGNAANNDGDNDGDNIYTTSMSISVDSAAGIFSNDVSDNSLTIQSIAYNKITVHYDQLNTAPVRIELYDVNGTRVQTLLDETQAQGTQTHTFKLKNQLTNGLYLVHYVSGDISAARKIYIQK